MASDAGGGNKPTDADNLPTGGGGTKTLSLRKSRRGNRLSSRSENTQRGEHEATAGREKRKGSFINGTDKRNNYRHVTDEPGKQDAVAEPY